MRRSSVNPHEFLPFGEGGEIPKLGRLLLFQNHHVQRSQRQCNEQRVSAQ